MKAVLMDGFGDAGVLRRGDAPVPEPAAGQVLIEVVATTVNHADISQRKGKYPPPPGESEILGLEVAGVVRETGPGVERFGPGDRVMTLVAGGGYAEFACAYEGHLVRIPEALSWEEAACVCETYVTAYLNLFMLGGLGDGDAVLLHVAENERRGRVRAWIAPYIGNLDTCAGQLRGHPIAQVVLAQTAGQRHA